MSRNWDRHDAEVLAHRNLDKLKDSEPMFFGVFFVCHAWIWMFCVWVPP
jgi:hypothetical protein